MNSKSSKQATLAFQPVGPEPTAAAGAKRGPAITHEPEDQEMKDAGEEQAVDAGASAQDAGEYEDGEQEDRPLDMEKDEE